MITPDKFNKLQEVNNTINKLKKRIVHCQKALECQTDNLLIIMPMNKVEEVTTAVLKKTFKRTKVTPFNFAPSCTDNDFLREPENTFLGKDCTPIETQAFNIGIHAMAKAMITFYEIKLIELTNEFERLQS